MNKTKPKIDHAKKIQALIKQYEDELINIEKEQQKIIKPQAYASRTKYQSK